MARAECIIDIMEGKDYITVQIDVNHSIDEIPIYEIRASNKIHNCDVKEEINDIMSAVIRENPDQYIVAVSFSNGNVNFCYRKDVESFIANFIATNNEKMFINELTHHIREWINSHYDYIEAHPAGYGRTVLYNLKIREERKEKEEREDAKALDLLYSIL